MGRGGETTLLARLLAHRLKHGHLFAPRHGPSGGSLMGIDVGKTLGQRVKGTKDCGLCGEVEDGVSLMRERIHHLPCKS